MPFLSLMLSARCGGPDAQLLARPLANELTGLTHRVLNKDPKLTAIAVQSIDADNWFVGGQSLAAQGLASFRLEIAVTAGTNTKAEMAAYIQAVFALMEQQLGSLHEASYVIVNEVPASAWGYGGRTQEFRFIAGRLQVAA